MRAVKSVSFKIAILVVAMLAAIGAWEITKGTVLDASASYHRPAGIIPPGAPTDHFVCYQVSKVDSDPAFVAVAEIRNQFEYRVIRVKHKGKMLCVPTAKALITLNPPGEDHDDGDDDDDDDDHGHHGHDKGKR